MPCYERRPKHLAEGRLDVLRAGGAADAQRGVVVARPAGRAGPSAPRGAGCGVPGVRRGGPAEEQHGRPGGAASGTVPCWGPGRGWGGGGGGPGRGAGRGPGRRVAGARRRLARHHPVAQAQVLYSSRTVLLARVRVHRPAGVFHYRRLWAGPRCVRAGGFHRVARHCSRSLLGLELCNPLSFCTPVDTGYNVTHPRDNVPPSHQPGWLE